MSNEIDIYNKSQLTAKDIRAQINLIQEVMRSVMKEETHYGTIPGCSKPSLYKPGAEKILATFRLTAEPIVEDLSDIDEIRYRINLKIISASGQIIGYGVGECSSDEEKYKWKKAVCDAEFNETPEDRRRVKWFKGYGNKSDYQVSQIRTEKADIANTILKMAKKRSLIDGCLTTTACSDIFEQDIEDLEGVIDIEKRNSKPPVQKPQRKSQGKEENATIKIKEVSRQAGEKNGKPWTKYCILSTDDVTYNTFSDTIGEDATTLQGTDVEVVVSFKASKYGNTINDDGFKMLAGEENA